ncbi:MAG: hypothetical protein COB45_03470 [Gammaproteobacteria bacterium]|nr:MAG: hypothetical protein COB45_03470 [Gammaproteobacteria bacterium]PHR84173.1 MAG: hypothetical protein COA59_07860 [Colwellia sp.]
MKNTTAHIAIIALMLVTFIGQAFASSTMLCTHEMTMEMSMMDHDNMSDTESHIVMMLKSSEQNNNQSALMECCQEQCQCPMSGCISLSVLLDSRFNSGAIAEQKIIHLSLIHQSQVNTSLYRPPIS